MAKLYAELTARTKGGRVASKSDDVRLDLDVYQQNKIIGRLSVYQVIGKDTHRVVWENAQGAQKLIQDTESPELIQLT